MGAKGYKRVIGLLLLLCLFSSCMLAGCSRKESVATHAEEKKSDAIQIGLSMDSYLIERWQRDRDVFVSKAKELGAEVNVQNANGDIQEQISQIEYFIKKKMDVIVIVAIDANSLSEVVEKAKKAGIKIIAYDRLICNADVDLYISFDNEQVGALMAQAMKKVLDNQGTIIRINGSPTDNNVNMSTNGFDIVMRGSNIKVDVTEYSVGWRAENGFKVTSDYLMSGKVPDGIVCGNDGIAAYAIKALAENRLAGKVFVIGQDADLDACQRIVEGTQYMTVYKPVEILAQTAAERAVELAQNIELNVQATIDDGTYEVPYEKLEPYAVTKDNMDEVIIGKYHQRSDVYLNITK